MTNRLVDDRDAVAVLAQQVADRIGIPVSHIEKDFWVTEVLRGAVAAAAVSGLEVVFKGGTSLSKEFRLTSVGWRRTGSPLRHRERTSRATSN